MITLTLPDGATRQFDGPIDGLAFAESISKSLAKKALAWKVDGEVIDLARQVEADAEVAVITAADEDGVDLMRHDCAHVLAEAVQELFPGTQVTIGPVIENGFYYDFARETPFSLDDLEAIEKRMKEIVDRNEEIVREEWNRDEAVAHFREIGEEYKAEIIAAIPADQAITVYRQGWKICAVARICRPPASWAKPLS